LEYAPELAPVVEGDLGKLRQVLGNLLGNAVKFTARGQITLTVAPLVCQGPCAEPCIRFVVRDTGPGIPADEQEAVFEAFRQRDIGHQGGTGLGLAISRKLVAAMGGELILASEPGKGCEFSFSLPLQRSSAQLPAEAQPLHLGQSRDILLVEDNEINRLVAHGMLTRLGHRVTLAEDGRSALALVTERPFELALLDINLPDMDGMTLREDLAAISEEMHERPLPAIAISAQMYPEDIRHCLAAGFVDFVGKPVRLAVLANAIERLFRQEVTSIEPSTQLSVAASANRPGWANPVLDADLPLLGMARIRQLVGLFESQGRVLVDELAKGEGSEQRQLAHKLKGSALALGLSEFASHCAALEAGGGEPAAIGPQFEAAVSGLQLWLVANRDARS
jgi:two-component system sensor histidine kinase TorS